MSHTAPDRGSRLGRSTLAILDVIDAIPVGSVMTYGDVAAAADVGSPRLVGQVLSRFGHEVPWQRVVMRNGALAPHLAREQLTRLRDEGVALTANGTRVQMGLARWKHGAIS